VKRTTIFIFIGLILSGLWFMTYRVQAGGSTIVVTTTADVDSNIDMQCSLREAIMAANTNTASGFVLGECPAGSDTIEDFIVLTSGETYTLAIAGKGEDAGMTGDLDILDDIASAALADVVITTDGEDKATIDGDYLDRVFHVMGAQVRLLNLNLRGGNPGADDGGNILAHCRPVRALLAARHVFAALPRGARAWLAAGKCHRRSAWGRVPHRLAARRRRSCDHHGSRQPGSRQTGQEFGPGWNTGCLTGSSKRL
jgi:CSLREA domain-containing protein